MVNLLHWRPAVVAASVLAIAALVITGLAISHDRYESDAVNTFLDHQLIIARSIAASVEEALNEAVEDMQYFALDPDIINAGPDASLEIDNFYETHSDVLNSISLIDAQGHTVLRTPSVSVLQDGWHQRELAELRDSGKMVISKVAASPFDRDVQVIQMLLPVFDGDRLVGAICACINLDKLWVKCLTRMETGHKSTCWVVDNRGLILHDTDGKYQGRTWEQVEQEWHEVTEHYDEAEEQAEVEIRHRVQNGEEGTAVCWNNNAGRVDELIAYTPIKLGRQTFGLAIVTPKSEIAAPVEAHARVTLALVVGMLAFLSLTGYIALKTAKARARLVADQERAEERRQAQELLRASEEKYRLMFETAATAITSVGADGIIVDCNSRIMDLLGYDRQEIIGQPASKIIHPDSLADVTATLGELVDQGGIVNKECQMVSKDGRVVPVHISSSGIVDQQDKFLRTICIITDITDRKQADERIRDRC